MTTCDWVLAAFIALALFYGYRQGLINVVARVGAVIAGYIAARSFTAAVAAYLTRTLPGLSAAAPEANEKLTAFLSLFLDTDLLVNRLLEMAIFIIIFVVVCWLVKKVARMITSVFGHRLLGKINKVLGAALSFLLSLILTVILADIVFPALAGMGVSQAPADFISSSLVIMPSIRYLLYLL